MTACMHVVWKPFYSVSHPALDAQHKHIIAIVNDLYVAMQDGNDRAVLKPLLDRLVQYTNFHFRFEEQVMQAQGYPASAEHKALHDRLRQRTLDLRDSISLVTGQDLLKFVKQWWVDHIQSEDKRYVPYLKAPAQAASAAGGLSV